MRSAGRSYYGKLKPSCLTVSQTRRLACLLIGAVWLPCTVSAQTATRAEPAKLRAQLQDAIDRITDIETNGPDVPFIQGALVDQATWVDDVLYVDLILPVDPVNLDLTYGDLAVIDTRITQSVTVRRAFAGTVFRVLDETTGRTQLLEKFIAPVKAGGEPVLIQDAGMPSPSAPEQGAGEKALRGPVANAGHQPTGALSGVVVFAAAGHGWTAGSSSWFLQRPLLLDMVEDYGNIDQLNYFVNYAFNAGATVVPFRPVGYQENEVVLDHDDPQVTYTGSWSISNSSPYYENNVTVSGTSYRFSATSTTETAVARYTPNLPEAGMYPVYTWVLDSSNRTTQLYRIAHSGGETEVTVDHRRVGRGWVWLGSYYFEAGSGGYVEISNQSDVAGNVIADAIRFGNGIGDIVGAGPGTVSGFPRDEEAQRYWAESETGINVVGMSSTIYNCCSSDQSDNVGTAARWAREMNNTSVNNERWRRVYLEFHSNASGAGARGTVALVTGNDTTNQVSYATILGDEIEQDMQILDSGFEHTWGSRTNPFFGGFGAISTTNNSNEFDATILEVAFHDNAQDAELLLDPKVRDAVARSSVHGLVKFLNTLPGSGVPLSFAPTAPRELRAIAQGDGQVTLSWQTPLTGEAHGDPATGYRVYRSFNGRGFDSGTDVGNVLSTTLSDVPSETTTYFRVAAYNAGGESMPSEVVAVRQSDTSASTVLIVNGFDRVSRNQDPRQTLPGLGTQRRPILAHVNSFDYVIQHGSALAAAGVTFDSCQNESIINGNVSLEDYSGVVWFCGEESTEDSTFDATEQTRVTNYLNVGGNLFVSGAEIAWDLDNLGNGQSFYNNLLKADYIGDDADTYDVSPSAGSIFDGISPFSFDDGTTLYDVEFPDQLSPLGGATTAFDYVGGLGGVGGIVFDGTFRLVNLGFPFETITSSLAREQIMSAAVAFFDLDSNPPPASEVIVESRAANGDVITAPTYNENGTLLSDDTVKSSVSGLTGLGSRYIEFDVPNSGTDNATFVPDLPLGGKYDVFVTWGDDGNASNVRFTVNHLNGANVQSQTQIPSSFGGLSNANEWISLGEFWFNEGQSPSTGSVNISEETVTGQPSGSLPRRVYIDAARWMRVRLLPNGDTNGDQIVDLTDYNVMVDCIQGPDQGYAQPVCEDFDFDVDGDVDLTDAAAFAENFDG